MHNKFVKKNQKSNRKKSSNLLPNHKLSKKKLITFGLAFAFIGGYIIYTGFASPTLPRSGTDRQDENSDSQIHIMYVLPSDGSDRSYDTDGAISTSVVGFENWLAGQTGGKSLRLDYFQGAIDITFYRLPHTNQQIMSGSTLSWPVDPNNNPYVREAIEQDLHNAGFNQSNKTYAVYYDGGSNFSCGGGAWPPTLNGNVAALYLLGAYGSVNCDNDKFTSDSNQPGIQEFKMIHEIFHTLGFAPSCAPHHLNGGHVSDDNRDLMWQGSGYWQPSILDVNHDDYFSHSSNGCLDLANSAYLTTFSSSQQSPTSSEAPTPTKTTNAAPQQSSVVQPTPPASSSPTTPMPSVAPHRDSDNFQESSPSSSDSKNSSQWKVAAIIGVLTIVSASVLIIKHFRQSRTYS